MVSLMEEMGKIKPNDISPLLTALDELRLHDPLNTLHGIIPGSELFWSQLGSEVQQNVQSGQWEVEDKESLRQLCSEKVVIEDRDRYFKQWLTIISVQTASNHKIPITSVCLNKSFKECEEDGIVLHSGLRLNQLLTVEKIHIETEQVNGEPRILTEEDVTKMLSYGLRSKHLKELSFDGCLLPLIFSSESIPADMQAGDIKVFWNNYGYSLHLPSGIWEVDNEDVVRKLCRNNVAIYRNHSELLQRCTIQLLENASYHDIPICCVNLGGCSPRVDESGRHLILQSDLSLSLMSSLQKLKIDDYHRRLTNEELAAILSYSSQCTRLKELMFKDYGDLPDIIQDESIPPSLTSRDVKVWNHSLYLRRLKLPTGRWQDCDYYDYLQREKDCDYYDYLQREKIHITSVGLNESFKECERDVILLHSGLRLLLWLTVGKIHIQTHRVNWGPKILTEEDFMEMLRYGLRSEHLKELSFAGCTLPLSFSSESLPNDMRSRDIKVCWSLFDSEVLLNVQSGQWEVKDKESLRQLCSGKLVIKDSDHYLQRWLTTISVQTASDHDIPITSLCLNKSLKECEEDVIVLHSGLRLNQLLTVEKIHIEIEQVNGEPRILTEEDVTKILRYGLRSEHLKEISFAGCTLPLSFSSESLPIGMRSRDIKVCWSLLDREVQLNVKSGQWEVKDKESLRQLCSEMVVIKDRDHYLQQCLTIISVQNASYHNIPISLLYLEKTFSKIDAGDIILHSGLRLPCPATVKQVVIDTEKGKEMTETVCFDIMMFVQQSHQLKEIEFDGCLLPLSFSSESIPAEMQSRDIKVNWNNYGYSLNLQSGVWEVDNEDVVRKLCTKNVAIYRNDSKLLQRCTIQLLENASYHGIPITSLNLKGSFKQCEESNIVLHSGLTLTDLSTIENIQIEMEKEMNEPKSLSEGEIKTIFQYVLRYETFKKLSFDGCLLPLTFFSGSIPAEMQSRDIKVYWNYYGYSLNLQSGVWEVDNEDVVRKLLTWRVAISNNDCELLQRCTIQLLETASYHDIPISCVYLDRCSPRVDESGLNLILQSGRSLSILSSLQKLDFYDRTLTNEDMAAILSYSSHCTSLKELHFRLDILKEPLPVCSIPSSLKSRNVKVWSEDIYFLYFRRLNLQTGRWQTCDGLGNLPEDEDPL